MSRRIRSHARHNAVAYLALFVALGGTSAYAANEWTGANVQDETLTGADVRGTDGTSTTSGTNGSLTGADIAGQQAIPLRGQPFKTGSLTTWDVKDNTLTGDDVLESSLAKVPDADNLDGKDSKDFARLGGVISADGTVSQGSGFTVAHEADSGQYQISFPAGTLSSSTCPPIAVVSPFSGFAIHGQITQRGCSGLGAGSFTATMLDSAGNPHDIAF